ncbi:MAG: serine hydrolase [Gemmatimonadetes bacterium]|nr:serine hydrolase [Gemmatimonadota bacterium]MYA64924.1 serine hydrolase [Gemmatimonadota bacterium]MYH53180.1 serine hydrolase [Gemmatimonadota bacterium]MYI46060.1 serine hydrolase [Gemmatimonadota bacterium]MYK67245.1 serine hydrolase [Gemmatimonadota bacterium]
MIPRPFLAVSPAVFLLFACGQTDDSTPAADTPEDATAALIARGDSLEIPGEWAIPPGDPLVHATAGFAKILCSNVFLSGLDPQFAAANTGFFSSPAELRGAVTDTVVDYENRRVHLTLPDGTVRSAKVHGGQGCVALPVGESEPYYEAVDVVPDLPDPATTPWPLGDVLPDEPFPADVDMEKVADAVAAAFDPLEALTAAFVVTHRGRLLAERYREGISHDTPLESWSMGKSLTGTLMGVLIHKGVYELWQPAPVPGWQAEGDGRAAIRIGDIMRMSSGLRFRAPQDPDFDAGVGYADHIYVYTGTVNSFAWAASKDQQWEPNTVGRYRNSDPVITNYLVRLGVEGALGENYHEFPQRHVFDKLGIRNLIPETDPYGNFLLQGYEFGSGRDWARLGNLYLTNGVAPNGERILPDGYADYAATLAPAWEADGRRLYGGAFFWVNQGGQFPVPSTAFYMAGAGGQNTIVIPSHEMVVVRLGHYTGAGPGRGALRRALELLMEAVPEN